MNREASLDLGVIGNGTFGAMIYATGTVVWCCLPRFDSEPVFGRLLDEDGGRVSRRLCGRTPTHYLNPRSLNLVLVFDRLELTRSLSSRGL